MGNNVNWWDKVRYKMDNMFSKGPSMMILWLGVLTLFIILLAAVLIAGFGIKPAGEAAPDFGEAFWQSLMRTLDPGTMSGDMGWVFRLVMLFVTIGGIFVMSTLIGLLSNGIEQRLEELRRGRSRVIETHHTVILGWTEQVYTIIMELINANMNVPDACIVVMGNLDKVKMENLLREKIKRQSHTRIVVRSGNPVETNALEILSLDTAKSIIVLSPESDDPDSEVIKTCLAITKNPERKKQPYHIVAELRDPKNLEVAKVVGKDEVEWLLTGDIIARVVAQTCRQSGLSVVYTDLLDFAGDEIYFCEDPSLYGKPFGDVLSLFSKNAVMGLWPKGGTPVLNPPMDTLLQKGDRLFLLAEDDDRIFLDDSPADTFDSDAIVHYAAHQDRPESTLLLGWNWRAPLILRELDHYVPKGSHLMIMSDAGLQGKHEAWSPDALSNMKVFIKQGDTTDRSLLEGLGLEKFDHVVLLCYSDALPAQVADSRTLITLLHLRDIITKQPGCHFSITSEMLDIRNRNLAEVTKADDFIVSDKLISLMFAQIAEQKALNAVFKDVFDPEGSEIYLKPVSQYIKLDDPVNFYTLIEASRRKGEIALGYRRFKDRNDSSRAYGVVLNPFKPDEIRFDQRDKIILIARD